MICALVACSVAPALHHARPHGVALHVELDAALPERLLRLADDRILRAALVDRHVDAAEHRAGELVETAGRQIPALLHARLGGDGRIERAFRRLHGILRGVDGVLRRRDGRMRGGALRDRGLKRLRRQPVDRHGGAQADRLDADDAPIGGLRGLQVRFRGQHLRLRRRDARFRLRDVGARHLADIEAVARLLELLLQHLHVAPLQIEDRGIAQHVHVGGRRIEQRGLHRVAQRLAARRARWTRPGASGCRCAGRCRASAPARRCRRAG